MLVPENTSIGKLTIKDAQIGDIVCINGQFALITDIPDYTAVLLDGTEGWDSPDVKIDYILPKGTTFTIK